MISLGAHHPKKGSVQVYLRMLCLVMTYYIVWLTTAENARYGQWPPAGVWAAPVLVTLYALLSLFMMDSVRKPWKKTKN
jgi:lipopolysaccharide export LptBFGC system permease protein LptF